MKQVFIMTADARYIDVGGRYTAMNRTVFTSRLSAETARPEWAAGIVRDRGPNGKWALPIDPETLEISIHPAVLDDGDPPAKRKDVLMEVIEVTESLRT